MLLLNRDRPIRWPMVTPAIAFLMGMGLISALARADEPAPVHEQLVAAFDKIFKGPYAGARAIHAKGIVCTGTFSPGPDAVWFSAAPHFRPGLVIPVVVRFSAFSGVPSQSDKGPGANPVGMAIKFLLPDDVDTDIVAHAYDGFPVGTPEDFLTYLDVMSKESKVEREAFLDEHPAARRFVDDPKPTPTSYATAAYFGVHAFRFSNSSAISHFGRYRIRPLAKEQYLTDVEMTKIGPDYLHDELVQRLKKKDPIRFRLSVQVAEQTDNVTDGSVSWPSGRTEVTLGTISLTGIDEKRDSQMFFSPMNLVPGIAASGDPLLLARTRAYYPSFQRRHGEE